MPEQNKVLVRAADCKRNADKVHLLSAVEEAAPRDRERLRIQAWRDCLSEYVNAMLTAQNTLNQAAPRQQLAGQDLLYYRASETA